jgi:3-hydroxy-9,10-secoandrosta-1,3,5(10)-triene-9,17-dione monooxygenase reductase component
MVPVTIHSTDPFATPDEEKSAVRRLRGRLAAPVTLWTAAGPAGLTVSSALVADGDPGRMLGLIDDESDFWEAVEESRRFAVVVLTPADRQLADRFAGLMPAPGGLFAGDDWADTEFGPVPSGARTWAGCRLESSRVVGWALLVEAVIERVEAGPSADPLIHYRGRYHTLGG